MLNIFRFDLNKYVDLSYSRAGQDVRYALNDDKLRSLGWEPKVVFDDIDGDGKEDITLIKNENEKKDIEK